MTYADCPSHIRLDRSSLMCDHYGGPIMPARTPITYGPRTPLTTVRCVMCDTDVETTRVDTLTCGPRCRKRRSRQIRGPDVPRSSGPDVSPERAKRAAGQPAARKRKK